MAIATGTALLAGSAIAGAGALAGGAMSASAAKKAARTQAESANQAAELQRQMFERQTELQEPFRQAGISGQNRLLDLLGLSGATGAAGYGTAAVPFSQTNFMADPGYAFRLKEGMKALERSAAARGLLKSGGTLRGTMELGQGLASQEYQNAFKRYYDERAAMLAPLEALRTGGQSASSNIAGYAGQYGANVGDLMTGAGAARAAGPAASPRGTSSSSRGPPPAARRASGRRCRWRTRRRTVRPC